MMTMLKTKTMETTVKRTTRTPPRLYTDDLRWKSSLLPCIVPLRSYLPEGEGRSTSLDQLVVIKRLTGRYQRLVR